MFPYNKLRRATELTVKSVEEVPVYCICRMPELPNTKWIECSKWKKWFHVFVFHPKPWLPALNGFVVCVSSVCM